MEFLKNMIYNSIKTEYGRRISEVYNSNVQYIIKGEIFKKKNVPELFDYKEVAKFKREWINDFYMGNNLYGISRVLREYSGFNSRVYSCIEHGVYFGSLVRDIETSNSGVTGIITFSDNRKKYISKKSNKEVLTIGPYINYAESLYSEIEISKIKSELGKTLLVFPTHSISSVSMEYDKKQFIDYINSIKNNHGFDTVLVCLYYKDIEAGMDKEYLENNFKIVTAGNCYDSNFLRRLKSIIYLSDYSISNSVGTHIGYCIALNKPHYVFKQEINKNIKKKTDELDQRQGEDIITYNEEVKEVEEAFSNLSNIITEKQKEVCNKYWGLNIKRSKKEINEYLTKCKKINGSEEKSC